MYSLYSPSLLASNFDSLRCALRNSKIYEKYTENLAEDALELLTISYVVNDKIMEDPPQGLHKVRRSKKSSLLSG